MPYSRTRRPRPRVFHLIIGLALLGVAPAVQASWNEAVDGDLSSDPNAPTAITVTLGVNKLQGTVQDTGGDPRDYVTFTVPAGQVLTGIVQIDYFDVNTSGPGDRGFHAINTGTTSFLPNSTTVGSFLGSDHLDRLAVGTDMLPLLAETPFGGIGFTPPLGPGDYTYLVQQTGAELTGYEIDLLLAPANPPVPLLTPVALGVLGAGLAGGGLFRMRRRSRGSA